MLGRPLKLPSSFFQESFKEQSHLTKNCREKTRYLALSWLQTGEHLTTIAQRLDVSRKSVGIWLKRYVDGGMEALREHPGPGRACKLPQQHMQALAQLVKKLQEQRSGGRVMGKHVHQALRDQGVACSLASVYTWLHKAGLSWVSSRSRHPQSDPKAQREFQKKIPSSRARSRGRQS